MARYIDGEKLEQEFKDNVPKHNAIINGSEYPAFVVDHTLHKIRNFPPADVVEVKHGKWKRNERNIPKMKEFHEKGIGLSMHEQSIFWTCSECGMWGHRIDKYCSNCGAKMDIKEFEPQKINHDSLCETETYRVGD